MVCGGVCVVWCGMRCGMRRSEVWWCGGVCMCCVVWYEVWYAEEGMMEEGRRRNVRHAS